nr:hypothetical protein Iba_chr06cCG9720 [Ipomoea batatas]GMD34887.1 hypothetical protein Iba_scaffold44287CG0010 [Ipomoea batatas]
MISFPISIVPVNEHTSIDSTAMPKSVYSVVKFRQIAINHTHIRLSFNIIHNFDFTKLSSVVHPFSLPPYVLSWKWSCCFSSSGKTPTPKMEFAG